MFVLTGCRDEPDDYSTNITLSVGEIYSLPNGTWISSNDAVAKVKNGNITALRRGKAVITDYNKTFYVSVVPNNYIIPEPYIIFGEIPQEVMNYMSSLGIFKNPLSSYNLLTYVSKDESKLCYQYVFKDMEGLKSVTTLVNQREYKEFEIIQYLTQRYVLISENKEEYEFISPDKKTKVYYTITENRSGRYYLIRYSPCNNL